MFKRVAFILLALSIVTLLSPANAWWIQWYAMIENQLFNLLIDSGRIIGISLILAGLLAPFEALGWWAGGMVANEKLSLLNILKLLWVR
jgi:hypothetical protein